MSRGGGGQLKEKHIKREEEEEEEELSMVSLDRRLGRCRRRRFQIGRARQMAIAYHSRAVRRPSVLRAQTAVPVDDFTRRNSPSSFFVPFAPNGLLLYFYADPTLVVFFFGFFLPITPRNHHFLLFVLSRRDCFIFSGFFIY